MRRIPLILSVPLGAAIEAEQNGKTRMAIPHEGTHAILTQIPEMTDEIKETLELQVEQEVLPRKKELLKFPEPNSPSYPAGMVATLHSSG